MRIRKERLLRQQMSWPDRLTWWVENGSSSCWHWPGSKTHDGYGEVGVRQQDGRFKTRLVHRESYKALVGPIPAAREIDHKCRNRACFNPAHLRVVTHEENMQNGRRALQTHCVSGHPFEGYNIIWRVRHSRRSRECRECGRISQRNYERRKRACAVALTEKQP